MTTNRSYRARLWLAPAVALTLFAAVPAASAQGMSNSDKMQKSDGMTKGAKMDAKKDAMKSDAMKKDGMKSDAMKKDGMGSNMGGKK